MKDIILRRENLGFIVGVVLTMMLSEGIELWKLAIATVLLGFTVWPLIRIYGR